MKAFRLLPTLLALMALLLAACNSSNPPSPPAPQQVYRWAVPNSDIYTFDPGKATDGFSTNAIQLVFTGMVQLNDKLNVTPELAASYVERATISSYTFHLRNGP